MYFAKESLELLRERVDLVSLLSSHLELKRSGHTYKALCPFHDEKTPSFMVQSGDRHYHCFGCGAHGDAIAFLMNHLKMSFHDAAEHLAHMFSVPLQQEESKEDGLDRGRLKEALDEASRIYQYLLLHTKEGHEALSYLYERGLDLDFIRQFGVGLALGGIIKKTLNHLRYSDEELIACGLLNKEKRDFFQERITFPIRNVMGAVIGFSARKYKEKTFGGKYINTPETPLFRKSQVLFGLNYSRKRIAKEQKALIVEGQIDALRLIQEGFTITVAGQGTAFGEGHMRELLQLGVRLVYLALDSDEAGQEATIKVGSLFQREGVEVKVVQMPMGQDPDQFLRQNGAQAFENLLEKSSSFLSFWVDRLQVKYKVDSPAKKAEMVQQIANDIRQWKNAVMVHESLRSLCHLTDVPEQVLGVGQEMIAHTLVKKSAFVGPTSLDPGLVLEMDLLRWLLLLAEKEVHLIQCVRDHLASDHFQNPICKKLFEAYFALFDEQKPRDLLSLAIALDDEDAQKLLSQTLHKKVNPQRSEEGIVSAIQKLLERQWMQEREEVRLKIQSGKYSEEEVLELAKQFDRLKQGAPKVIV